MMNVYNQLMAQGGRAHYPKVDGPRHPVYKAYELSAPYTQAIRIKAHHPPGDVHFNMTEPLTLPFERLWIEIDNLALHIVAFDPGRLLPGSKFNCLANILIRAGWSKGTPQVGAMGAYFIGYYDPPHWTVNNLSSTTEVATYYQEEGHWETVQRDACYILTVAWWNLKLLTCKNVKLKQAPLKRVKPKKGKKQLFSYHVLDVPQPQTRYNETNPPSGRTHRLHLCRGHFRTYTDAAPLFGKVTGRIWVPAHVKGRDRSGIVHQDYAI